MGAATAAAVSGNDVIRLAEIKQAIDLLAEEKAVVEARIIETMTVAQAKSSVTPAPWGGKVVATVVAAERVVINEESLKKALGAATWGKVTKQVLDKDKLEAHVATGAIPATTVAACSETKENKPYVRLSGDSKNPAMGKAVEEFVADKAVDTRNAQGGLKPAAKRVKKPKK